MTGDPRDPRRPGDVAGSEPEVRDDERTRTQNPVSVPRGSRPMKGDTPTRRIERPEIERQGSGSLEPPSGSLVKGTAGQRSGVHRSISGRALVEPPEDAAFRTGDLVAGRYRIVGFLARGGVGEVYEVDDTALDLRVALKTIRRRSTSDPNHLERFKREIQLARQVTHPNICRLYEFGEHVSEGEEPLHFLTMELLEGETLLDRIHGQGWLGIEETLDILLQVSDGLEAAHRVGVVHRDLKSQNVVLVPDPGMPGGIRVVITDFGLAQSITGPELRARLTAQHAIVGTPEYMAPEQVEEGEITPATDIYALGIVVYEMLVGETPFRAENALGTAFLHVTAELPSVRAARPDVPMAWDGAIRRCLAKDPAERFASSTELVEAVTRRRRSTPLLIALGILGVVGLGLVLGWDRLFPPAAPESVSIPGEIGPIADRRSVALLGLHNLSGREEDAWLGTALAEMLATEAAAGDRLRVISGAEVSRVRLDLGLEAGVEPTPEELAAAGRLLGTDLVVTGSYELVGEGGNRELRLDLVAHGVADGEIVGTLSEVGREGEQLDLVEAAGRSLRSQLDLVELSDDEARAARVGQPTDVKALRYYAEGLEHLRRLDAGAARGPLEAAVEAEPGNPLVRIALSSAYQMLGYWERAREEAARATELADGASRRDSLWIEAHYFQVSRQSREAMRNYEALWEYFPDEIEYGLRLAAAQTSNNDPEAALRTLSELRAHGNDDPRIALEEARAARAVSDYALQLDKAAEAVTGAEAIGASLLVAQARIVEAGALRDLGRHEDALEAYASAYEIYDRKGIEGPKASLVLANARVHRHLGHYDRAEQLSNEALELAEELDDLSVRLQAMNTLAILRRQDGRLQEAKRMHERELEASRSVGRRRSIQISLTTLGVAELDLGLLDDAEAHFTEALRLAGFTDHNRSVAVNQNMLGRVWLRRGRLDEAEESFRSALELNQGTHNPRGRAYYLSGLAEVDRVRGRFEQSRNRHEEALRIRRATGEGDNIAFSAWLLARLALEQGQIEEAESRASEAVEAFREVSQSDGEGLALLLLARARFARGDAEGARTAFEEAEQVLGGTEAWDPRFELVRTRAELDGSPTALRQLALMSDRSEERGFVDQVLEAKLLLARLSGDRIELESVADRAEELGFLNLAARTREASESSPLG